MQEICSGTALAPGGGSRGVSAGSSASRDVCVPEHGAQTPHTPPSPSPPGFLHVCASPSGHLCAAHPASQVPRWPAGEESSLASLLRAWCQKRLEARTRQRGFQRGLPSPKLNALSDKWLSLAGPPLPHMENGDAGSLLEVIEKQGERPSPQAWHSREHLQTSISGPLLPPPTSFSPFPPSSPPPPMNSGQDHLRTNILCLRGEPSPTM